jgi:hypothetical protein
MYVVPHQNDPFFPHLNFNQTIYEANDILYTEYPINSQGEISAKYYYNYNNNISKLVNYEGKRKYYYGVQNNSIKTRIMMPIIADGIYFHEMMGCITVDSISSQAGVNILACESLDNTKKSRQEFMIMRGLMRGSHFKSTIGQIRMYSDPNYCLHKKMPYNNLVPQLNNTPDHALVLDLCIGNDKNIQSSYFEFELITNNS